MVDDGRRAALEKLGTTFVCVVSPTQRAWGEQHAVGNTVVVSDDSGALKTWFDEHAVGSVIVRPDRFVAAACLNAALPKAVDALVEAAYAN